MFDKLGTGSMTTTGADAATSANTTQQQNPPSADKPDPTKPAVSSTTPTLDEEE